MLTVQGIIHRLVEPGAHIWLVAVADGLQHEFTQRLVLEAHPAQHIEDLPAQRNTLFLQLLKEPLENLALARFAGNQVPQMADFRLANTVNASEALLQPVRIPGQVVIDHQVRSLQVDTLARRVRCHQHQRLWIV